MAVSSPRCNHTLLLGLLSEMDECRAELEYSIATGNDVLAAAQIKNLKHIARRIDECAKSWDDLDPKALQATNSCVTTIELLKRLLKKR